MKKTLIISAIILGLSMTGLFVANAENQKSDSMVDSTNEVLYTVKSVYDEKEDGWVYGFEIDYIKDSNNRIYNFDGYNLKYKKLDGYYVALLDENNQEVGQLSSKYITLSISKYHKDEVKMINQFFNEKKFDNVISISDLNELNITKFDKSYIVDLFNRTINSEMKSNPGKYFNDEFVNKVSKRATIDGIDGEWQIAYINDYGNLLSFNIEFIDNDGNYLSDIINNKQATEKQTKIYNDIQNIENNIVKTQTVKLNTSTNTKNLNSVELYSISEYSELDNLLLELSDELNK